MGGGADQSDAQEHLELSLEEELIKVIIESKHYMHFSYSAEK